MWQGAPCAATSHLSSVAPFEEIICEIQSRRREMIAQSEEGAGTDWTSNIGDQREREREMYQTRASSLYKVDSRLVTMSHTIVPLLYII